MEGLIGYLFGLAIGLIGLVVAVYIITEDGGGCFAYGVAIICVTTMALNAMMLVTHAKKSTIYDRSHNRGHNRSTAVYRNGEECRR